MAAALAPFTGSALLPAWSQAATLYWDGGTTDILLSYRPFNAGPPAPRPSARTEWQIFHGDASGGLNFAGEYPEGSDSLVSLVAVPEPGSCVSLLRGLGLIIGFGRGRPARSENFTASPR